MAFSSNERSMKRLSIRTTSLLSAVIGSTLATNATAQTLINTDFATSATLTLANSPYALDGDIYVLPGATLTIEAGVRFESTANSTLAITRGAQIIANGTKDAPIVFTSQNDTGVYRQLANNEWGNLTIMGAGYISEDEIPSNSSAPASTNYADMEGLTPANPANNDYGGGNDNDDSGSLSYCAFRYGGVASIPGKELNGLSLGGVGRNTDIHHIEILNNIDDGIEIWGGTVNLKYVSIWNVGDDSLDIDQGWRGKAQFGLIVQGLSNTGAQGSGFGDNAMEIDGAERCDWQPVTTCALHNWTVIGGENDAAGGSPTDELVEFRDNARVQFLNCIFMDAGKEVINDKVTDGEANNNTTVCGPGSAVPQMLARMTTSAGSTFGVNAFESQTAPEDLVLPRKFDVIWVASLFSHLPRTSFTQFLARLYEALEPDGLLIFSTHTPEVLAAEERDASGFTFVRASESHVLDLGDYGSTFVEPTLVRELCAEVGIAHTYGLERELWNIQDVYVVSPSAQPGLNDWSAAPIANGTILKADVSETGHAWVGGYVRVPAHEAPIQEVALVLGENLPVNRKSTILRPLEEQLQLTEGGERFTQIDWYTEGPMPELLNRRETLCAIARLRSGAEWCFDATWLGR